MVRSVAPAHKQTKQQHNNMARGNKAHRDAYISILAEVKEMMRHLHPALQKMNKTERIDGAGAEMRRAAYAIIREYYIAYHCPETRKQHVEQLIGEYGVHISAFEICCRQGTMEGGFKLPIAMRMERIEEGIKKWNNAMSAQRQEHGQGTRHETEATVSETPS